MQPERLGIVSFFGILIPGTFLSFILLLGFAILLEIVGVENSHQLIMEDIESNLVIFTAAFLFGSYLFGVVIRLYAPDSVDSLSKLFLTKLRRKKDQWAIEKFPYPESILSLYQNQGMRNVVDTLKSMNEVYFTKTYFNYCKLVITAKNPALARQVKQQEALIRFLAGIIWTLLYAGVWISIIGFVVFCVKNQPKWMIFYGGLLLINLITFFLILERFKFQRRKEVEIVWDSIHIIQSENGNFGN